MEDITADTLEKKQEYKDITSLFSQWKPWQRHYFLCDFTSIVPMNILEIFLTDFEPLYHSGYTNIESLDAPSVSSMSPRNRSHIHTSRLEHVHNTDDIFLTKTIYDYIQKPNLINIHAISQSVDTNTMKVKFLKQINKLKQVYIKWATFEYIHVIHILLPLCSNDTVKFLSLCVNRRVFEHRSLIRFPQSVIENILKYLTPASLCVTAQVCRIWQQLSYRSDVWRIRTGQMATKEEMEQLFQTCALSDDAMMWRATYIELKRKKVHKKGSIVHNGPKSAHRRELTRRRLAIEALRCSPPSNDSDYDRFTPSPDDLTPRKIAKKKVTVCRNRSRSLIPIPKKDIPVFKLTHPDTIERVASFHGSLCELDPTSYEEIVNAQKRHSKKHCTFIKDILGYNDWFSALSPVYPLEQASELIGHKGKVNCLQFDALRIISACKKGTIRLWDGKTGRPVRNILVHKGPITSLQFDGFKLITSSWDQTVKIFSLKDFSCIATLTGHSESVTKVMFDKAKIISLSVDKTMRIYDATSPFECTNICEGHDGPITDGDMDKETIITCSEDNTARLWDSTHYHCLRVIECYESLSCVTVDHNLILLGTQNGKLLFTTKTMVAPSHHILVHEGCVNCLWLYGTRLLTGGADGLVKEWDLPTGSLLRILHGHLADITCIQASNNSIVTCSHDKTLKLWSLTEIKQI